MSITTEELLPLVFSSSPKAPKKHFVLGSLELAAYELDSGLLAVSVSGGSIMDREAFFAPFLDSLRASGYRIATFMVPEPDMPLEKLAEFRKLAPEKGWPGWSGDYLTWPGIMEKAKRLSDSGNVTILRNGYNNVVAQVEGDHGNYDVEFMRDDPSSRAISAWSCNCPWGQWAWGRMRNFKQYEGRPCWAAGSLVNLSDGTYKAIEDVQVGDCVLTAFGAFPIEKTWKNSYQGEMISIRRVGASTISSVTEDHKMIVNQNAGKLTRDVEQSSATKVYRVKRALQTSDNWEKTLAKEVQVGDWVKLAYPIEEVPFHLDIFSISPYLHLSKGRIYKSTYDQEHRYVIKRRWHSQPSSMEIEPEGVSKLLALVKPSGDGCWEWQGSLDSSTNQIRFCWRHKQYNVRKILWEIANGPRPQGSRIRSHCNNALCCNPSHMKVKSKSDPLGKRTINTLPAKLEASEALLTIAGYYLAEGNIEGNGCQVAWTFHINELEYVQRLEDALRELDAGSLKRYPDANRITVKVSNSVLAEVLKYLCGSGSRSKKLSKELMLMGPELQKFFLERYAEGDGHISPDGRFCICTTSDVLAKQIVMMGCRVYDSIPSQTTIKNNGGPINRDKKLTINQIRFNQQFNQGIVRLEAGYYAAKITQLDRSSLDGYVYNVTVPPYNTVAIDDICHFQCAHMLSAYWRSLGTPLDEDTPDSYTPTPGELGPSPSGAGAPEFQAPITPDVQPPDNAVIPQQEPLPPYEPGTSPAGFAAPPNAVSVPGARPPTPANPVNWPMAFSHIKKADERIYQNGEVVQLNQPTYGILDGPPEHPLTGTYREIPMNSHGEVLEHDPESNLISAMFPLHDTGAGEPWHARIYLSPEEVRPSPLRPPGTYLRRRY